MKKTVNDKKLTKISIIGSGVIGKASGLGFLSKNLSVTFIDSSPKRVAELKKENLIVYAPEEVKDIEVSDINFLCVPTPTRNKKIDLTYIKKACEDLGTRMAKSNKYCIVAIRSTVIPGTTRGIALKTLEQFSNKVAGIDFGLCMNPEYLREVSAVSDSHKPWITLIGEYDRKSGDTLEEVYKDFDTPIYKVSLEEAELQKYIHNLFNAVKIAYFNEFRVLGENMHLRTQMILSTVAKSCEGMWNPQYGIKDLGPFDGHCLPKDTQALASWAEEKGFFLKILNSAIDSNKDYEKITGKYSPHE